MTVVLILVFPPPKGVVIAIEVGQLPSLRKVRKNFFQACLLMSPYMAWMADWCVQLSYYRATGARRRPRAAVMVKQIGVTVTVSVGHNLPVCDRRHTDTHIAVTTC